MQSEENIYWKKFLEESDPDSFSRIYENYAAELYAYGMSLGFASDICMDAIQDVFCKIYTQKNALRHIFGIRLYLLRSVKNRLFDIHKKLKRTQALEPENHTHPALVSIAENLEDEEEYALLKQKVETMLAVLTRRQREIIYLRYMQNLEYDDIAVIMGLNPVSARKLVYRALETIRKNFPDISFSVVLYLAHSF